MPQGKQSQTESLNVKLGRKSTLTESRPVTVMGISEAATSCPQGSAWGSESCRAYSSWDTVAGTGLPRPFQQGRNIAAPTSFKFWPLMAMGISAPETRFHSASSQAGEDKTAQSCRHTAAGKCLPRASWQGHNISATTAFTLEPCMGMGTSAAVPSLFKAQ